MEDFFKALAGASVSWEGIVLFFIIRELLGFVRLYLDKQRMNKGEEIQDSMSATSNEMRENIKYIKTLSDTIRTNLDNAIVEGQRSQQTVVRPLLQKIDTLYDMHNVRDVNGIPVWYQNPQLTTSITKMANAIEALVETIGEQNKIFINSVHGFQLGQKDILMEIRQLKNTTNRKNTND